MQNRLIEANIIFLFIALLLCSCANSPKQETACVALSKFSMSDFPFTHDAFNINQSLKGESALFYTKLSIPKIIKFYRNEFRLRDICENNILTEITESSFSVVFNDMKKQKIVLQGIDLGYSSHENSRVINARIEE